MTAIEEDQTHQEMVRKTAEQLVRPVVTGSAFLASSFRREVLTEVIGSIWNLIGDKPRYEIPNPDECVRLD